MYHEGEVQVSVKNNKLSLMAQDQQLSSLAVLGNKYKEKVKTKDEVIAEKEKIEKVSKFALLTKCTASRNNVDKR